MYSCEYCGPVIDCMHRREKLVLENSPIIQDIAKDKDARIAELESQLKSLAVAREIEVGAKYIDDWRTATERVKELEAENEKLRESKKFMLENQANIFNKRLAEYGERVEKLRAALNYYGGERRRDPQFFDRHKWVKKMQGDLGFMGDHAVQHDDRMRDEG